MDMEKEQMPEAGGGMEEMIGLAKQGGDVLAKLAQAVDSNPGASEEDKAQAAQLMDMYMDLAERMLGGEGKPKAEPMDADMVPAQAGMKGIPMGPQGAV